MNTNWRLALSDALDKVGTEQDVAHRRNLLRQEDRELRRMGRVARRLRRLGYTVPGVARHMRITVDDVQSLLEDCE